MSSCVVSKKKYDQLSTAKRGVDAKLAEQIATNKENQETINSLNKKVETTTSDFNKLKNEMAENNAAKDDRIAELNSRLANLNADASDLNTKMNKVKFQQSFLERENKENESIISGLKAKIKTLNNSISELNKEKNDANTNAAWAKKEMKTKLAKKEQELAIKQKEIDALNAKITEN
ncbi:MAG: hypothetical protein N4A49_00900, partial [Marinifilaceae bacterium]|nr:hypothetical protein [Marinifilaceae bacterium]